MLYRELAQRLSVNVAPISAQWQWDSRQWDDATIDNNMTFETVAEMLSLQESPESEEELPEPAPKSAPSNIRKREDEAGQNTNRAAIPTTGSWEASMEEIKKVLNDFDAMIGPMVLRSFYSQM